MAKALNQTGLVSTWHDDVQQHLRKISLCPKILSYDSCVSCPVKRFPSLKLKSQAVRSPSSSSSELYGKKLVFHESARVPGRGKSLSPSSSAAQMTLGIGKAQKWWETGLQPNMREVTSAQDLVDSLLNAGDKLVVVDFFSPGCGGCRALHPKICQLAEMNPDVQFLQVNYEEHKSMCYSLNVHVLPFFRFYRGAHGRLCSFSCTNATIKKFKDALAKHTPDRCSLGPTKGLEEKELLALSANKDLSFTYIPKPDEVMHEAPAQTAPPGSQPLPLTSLNPKSCEVHKERSLSTAGR
ncbi:thioredoxin-like 1-1, chloroplastic [Neltuma alba]|uniref:thioredoxin-like 1-1, chloroplastic n=1 Tax=Neltuma alba TaxID=207710 RepID=UPI0010A44974|nr:thioredoxin-like 1-1, chloroplastic [Prosopis alba]XP_028795836.1 thioredoxin-like 1-1, chloroplastic [Prosopis alba]